MKYSITSLGSSIELYLLILIAICFVYSNNLLNESIPRYIHEFKTLEDLIDSSLNCNNEINFSELEKDTSFKLNRNDTQEELPLCPIDVNRLKFFDKHDSNTWFNYRHIGPGGRFKPSGCRARQKVAIVIPYRNRKEHLDKFTLYIHQFLPDQLIEYTVYVIEQSQSKPFNRARLFNVAMIEINKIRNDICCFIFHDVDMLPLDQRNLYMCSLRPKHLSPCVNTLRFKLLYYGLFGGVTAMTREHYEAIGGFANDFYGWGGEDDDIFRRFRRAGIEMDRTPQEFGIYSMMRHNKMAPNPDRYSILENSVNGSNKATYNISSVDIEPLYTRFLVEI